LAQKKYGASLNDVAAAAGVSPSTVSRYLNSAIKLPAATSERIDSAISALRYVPNPAARSLGRGRSDTVGLVIPDIANPFFAALASLRTTALSVRRDPASRSPQRSSAAGANRGSTGHMWCRRSRDRPLWLSYQVGCVALSRRSAEILTGHD